MDTREWMSDFLDKQPADRVALFVGLVLKELLSRQTMEEQSSETTKVDNTIGFNAFDAKSGTRDAKAFVRYGSLSDSRVHRWTRKDKRQRHRICKYHSQIDKDKLESLLNSTPSPAKNKLDDARQEYARIRGLFADGSDFEPRKFDAAVVAKVGKGAAPAQYIAAAKAMRVPCRRCAGTGQYITMVVNNKPTGPGGICFRCEGKGVQTEADARRNWGYDRYGIKLNM